MRGLRDLLLPGLALGFSNSSSSSPSIPGGISGFSFARLAFAAVSASSPSSVGIVSAASRPAGAAVLPIDAAIQSNLRETTTRVLASLTPREERILRMRFGIGMNTDHTLEEVGQQFSLTRERIRQIEAKALRKLKHPSRSSVLRSFLDN